MAPSAPEPRPTSRVARAADWAFRNRRTGEITVGQWPNLPLWLFGGASLASWLLDPPGPPGLVLRAAAFLCLAWWAVDEVLRGVNPWRRLLGGSVLAAQAATWLLARP
ncbi:hypothetical protein [Methylobacterium nigriterrae]|uniref:hypothetical protein n=1 Tax=Methylobacterium nigriterrae TaxID=3127512 RepID=UPI003013D6B2